MSWADIRHHYEDGPEDPVPPAFERRDEHTARKTHACAHCEGSIFPGQRYAKYVYLDEDNQLQIHKWHIDRDLCAAEAERVRIMQQEADAAQAADLARDHAELCREMAALNGDLHYALPQLPQPVRHSGSEPEDLPF